MYADTSNVPGSSTSLTSYPRVTIITAVYNAQKYLEECILSVLNQTYTNFEYIIIDGGSTDSSIDIIKKYQHRISYWESGPDDGIYDAWNKGLVRAKGDWISFVGADDQLLPDAIGTYVNHIVNHPKRCSLQFVSSRIELVDEKLTPLRIVGEAWAWERFKISMITWHVGAFHSKRLFAEYGVFDSSYKVSGDYELLLRPRNYLITSFIDHLTVKMRIGGTSAKNLVRASEETYRAKMKNRIISSMKGNIMIYVDRLRLLMRSLSND